MENNKISNNRDNKKIEILNTFSIFIYKLNIKYG